VANGVFSGIMQWPVHAIEILMGAISFIGLLIGIIYKNLQGRIDRLSNGVVYKDTCEKVQGRFCDEIKEVKQDVKDMRKEVNEGISDLKREIINGRG
jgi:hypothetical protein